MFCKLKTVVSLLRVIVTLLSLRPFGNIQYFFSCFKNIFLESPPEFSENLPRRQTKNSTLAIKTILNTIDEILSLKFKCFPNSHKRFSVLSLLFPIKPAKQWLCFAARLKRSLSPRTRTFLVSDFVFL